MSAAQEVPNPGQEQMDTEGGVPDGPSPTPTTASNTTKTPAQVTVKKEPGTGTGTAGASNGKSQPAEICVTLGDSRTQGMPRPPTTTST